MTDTPVAPVAAVEPAAPVDPTTPATLADLMKLKNDFEATAKAGVSALEGKTGSGFKAAWKALRTDAKASAPVLWVGLGVALVIAYGFLHPAIKGACALL